MPASFLQRAAGGHLALEVTARGPEGRALVLVRWC
jgi:hypothetical protein